MTSETGGARSLVLAACGQSLVRRSCRDSRRGAVGGFGLLEEECGDELGLTVVCLGAG